MSRINPYKIGIDLGTTYCCCSYIKKNAAQPIIDCIDFSDGYRIMPSHVIFKPNNDEIVVGSAAKFTPESVGHAVFDAKRFIGRKYYDPKVQDDINNWPFKVINDGGIPKVELIYNNNTVHLTANEISTEILKAITLRAAERIGNNKNAITEAVITVPAYFKQKQREETKKAAQAANLKVIQIINEPTAAAIAYAYQRMNQPRKKNIQTLLIYDFGGGTFDVSIIRLNFEDKTVVVLATGGDSHLGGNDIDHNILNDFLQLYNAIPSNKNKSIKEMRRIKLLKVIEKAKCLLSDPSLSSVELECDWLEDSGVDTTLTRARVNDLNKLLYERTMTIVDEVLVEGKLSVNDIDDVVLVGGSSKIPKIIELISKKFKKVCQDIDPEQIVARGAAIVANIEDFNFGIIDVLTHTLSTDIEDDKICEMIHKNTLITKCEETHVFANYKDDQSYIDINIYEGDGDSIEGEEDKKIKRINRYVEKIGNLVVDIPTPNKSREVKIDVNYKIDESGILVVSATSTQNNISRTMRVQYNN